jgi:hypothetical protein
MLTTDDLQNIKIAVREIVREEIQTQVPPLVCVIVEKELKPIKRDLRKLRKDLNVTITFFDNSLFDLKQRTVRIEEHLHLV